MNGNNRIFVEFSHCPDGVIHPFLHLRIRPLHGIQFNGVAELPCGYRRYSTSAHPDAVIIATQHDYFVSGGRIIFQAVGIPGIPHPAGQHDNFIITIGHYTFLMFESQQTPADQRLSEFIAKITGAI
ncbi:hypothetical protein DSECCO2_424030 [anaerobic digester metagenome]